MAAKEATLTERVQASYQQLSCAATNLNVASDGLSKAISALDVALKRLNLGISAWAKITGGEDLESQSWWQRDIGYTQVGTEWVIALRSRSGFYFDDGDEPPTIWRFSEAPRWMQVEAVARIPDLIDKLRERADETTTKLKNRAEEASQLAAVVEEVSKREEDWRSKLVWAMLQAGLADSAAAIDDPETEVALVNNELKIKAPSKYKVAVGSEEIRSALGQLGNPDVPFKVSLRENAKPNTAKGRADG